MKITKQYETPKPPLAKGITIALDMQEAAELEWALSRYNGGGYALAKLHTLLKHVVSGGSDSIQEPL